MRKSTSSKEMHPADIALAEAGEAVRIALIGLVAENDEGQAAKQAHRADGDDDRGQAKTRHQLEPLKALAAEPDDDADQHQHRRAGAGLYRLDGDYASAMIEATERSISPEMISSAMATFEARPSVKLKVRSDSE